MLAQPGEPFDDPTYHFEVKWDGTRALAFIEAGGYRLMNRRRIDMTERYPEFAFLADLPPGTVLDGEMVVLRNGQPDFGLLQSREQARTPLRIRSLAKASPATYVVFDLLYQDGKSQMDEPLTARRDKLRKVVQQAGQPLLIISEGLPAQGKAFFQEACARNLEGMVAKRLLSPYLPGRRTDAWIKVKRSSSWWCAIIGFLPSGKNDFRSLILATEEKGELRYAGKVGTGFDNPLRKRLNQLLWSRLRATPIVPCKLKGTWIEPGLYCRVSCMERTEKGEFRAPVFEELRED